MIEKDVPLAPRTTLGLGGAADHFAQASNVEELRELVRWARARDLPFAVLGGGSNTLVPDEGLRGLVISLAMHEIVDEAGLRRAGAGVPWDDFVARAVHDGLAGVECLAGIPGGVGATPIQNVGAYGQEVAETITSVQCLRLDDLSVEERSTEECAFAYRDSDFKRRPGRYIVTEVSFSLSPGGPPARRYRELVEHSRPDASLAEVREMVIALRRKKAMVLDESDTNTRSAGSFFTNPIVPKAKADELVQRCVADGVVERPEDVPQWPAGEQVKLAAGWLIERAGFERGRRRGNIGQSEKHALALVHLGGGTTSELLAYADELVRGVEARFGVRLEREPQLLQLHR